MGERDEWMYVGIPAGWIEDKGTCGIMFLVGNARMLGVVLHRIASNWVADGDSY
jgi:hypothetical protein